MTSILTLLLLAVFASVLFGAPIAGLLWWSLNKSKRLRIMQEEQWTSLASELGGELSSAGRHYAITWQDRAATVIATISHQVVADAAVARKLRTNNEFRTQVHALVPGGSRETFLIHGTKPGKGRYSGDHASIHGRFTVSEGSADAVLTPASVPHILALEGALSRGTIIAGGPEMISVLFWSNETPRDQVKAALELVGELANRSEA